MKKQKCNKRLCFPCLYMYLAERWTGTIRRVHQFSLYAKENLYIYSISHEMLLIVESLKTVTMSGCDYKTLCWNPTSNLK